MTAPAIVLVHGYTGSVDDMAPLAHGLRRRFGDDAVHMVRLPGHQNGRIPPFDAVLFERVISNAVDQSMKQGRPVVLLGHSTGGCLALGALEYAYSAPALVILAATPARIVICVM